LRPEIDLTVEGEFMKSFRSITVGVSAGEDARRLSAGSLKAVRQAVWLAQQTGASLSLLHSTWGAERNSEEAKQVFDSIEALTAECSQAGVAVQLHRSDERPWIALIKQIVRGDSDFLFVGKHNSSNVRDLGRNTLNLLRNCPAPVWVVDPMVDPIGTRILAATDLSDVGVRVTQLAAQLSVACECELHVVHAWQQTMEAQLEHARESDDDFRRRVASSESKIAEQILTGLKGSLDSIEPKLHIGCTSPELAILEGVDVLKPELVVMGTLSRTGVPGLLVGNIAEHLLGRIPCSLLTIKPAGFVSPVTD
jgi:universal stress protein E